MATARPETPGAGGNPRPEPPAAESRAGAVGPRRPRALPERGGGRRRAAAPGGSLPPRPLAPPVPPGEPPAPRIPPAGLSRRAAGEARAGGRCGLPPLLAVLTRRTGDAARLRPPRVVPPPPGPRLPPRPAAAGLWASPGRACAEGVALRPHPPLCRDAEGDAAPDPLGVQELYRQLGRTLPAERLRFRHEPPVEPAAAAADLTPPAEPRAQNTGETPRHGDARPWPRQSAGLFADYLRFVAATGSDFLCAIFHPRGGTGEEEEPAGAPQPHREPAPAPAEPYEKGLWKPVVPGPVPAGLERLQRRLNRLWAALGVPGRERLEMAVKYGSGEAAAQLPAALEAWEAAAGDILRRELLLARLAERGSEPARFLRRGPAAATARAGEPPARGRLRAALARCEARLAVALRRLRDGFGDAATFRGRPYAETLRRDAAETIYRAGALRAAPGGQPRRPPPGPAGPAASGRQ